MKNRNFRMVSAFMLLAVSVAWGLTRMNSVALWNSTVDNTTIGGTTAAAGHFTTLSASGTSSLATVNANNISGNNISALSGQLFANGSSSFVNGGSYMSSNASGSLGETDFVTQNGGGFQQFSWYMPNSGGTLGSPVMTLDHLFNLTVAKVTSTFVGNLTGNVTGNSTTSSSTTGNAATASAFDHTPTTCSTANAWAFGIAANGAPGCSTSVGGKTTSVGTTGATNYSTATASVPLSATMPDALYFASCSGIGPSGFPAIFAISKSTTSITVTIINGTATGAAASTYAEIDCTVSGT